MASAHPMQQPAWDCPRCTFHNGPTVGPLQVCEMCQLVNPPGGMGAVPRVQIFTGNAPGGIRNADNLNPNLFTEIAQHLLRARHAMAGGGGGAPAAADVDPDASVGATPAMLSRLTETCLDKEAIEGGNDECGVCLSEQHVGDLAILLDCGHAFHKACLVPWLKKNAICPSCREPLKAGGGGHDEGSTGAHRHRQEQRRQEHNEEIQRARERMNDLARREQERSGGGGGNARPGKDSTSASSSSHTHTSSHSASASASTSASASASMARGAPDPDEDPVLPESDPPATKEELGKLGARELKRRLDAINVSYTGIFEKQGLVDLLYKHQK
eukprot:m.190618 g.190618  ORF g.190618 m.190618 type:complete len:329 (+) comp18071_c0_seq1:115-1101(+)